MKKAPAQKSKGVVTQRNYVPNGGSKLSKKSMTVQDDTQSVAQLLLKHIQGMPVKEKVGGVYIDDADHDDLDGEKFHQADLAEKEDVRTGIRAMRARLNAEEQEYQKELKKREKAKSDPPKQAGNEGEQK